MEGIFAEVVLFSNIDKVLSYSVPPGLSPRVGCRVSVPVRNSVRTGVVVGLAREAPEGMDLKEIRSVLDENPAITPELIDLVRWTARYYHAGIGSCMALAFPPYFRQGRVLAPREDPLLVRAPCTGEKVTPLQRAVLDAVPEAGIRMSHLAALVRGSLPRIRSLVARGIIEAREAMPPREPFTPVPLEYTPGQRSALEQITGAIANGGFESFVLHGITGSGKTEVYLAAAMEALGRGKSVLYLVPEIALTPQTIDMVRNRVPMEVAVFHSGLAAVERAREFMKVALGGARFVLGTRSAVFAPLVDIGLVVVDEEHDHSYKQDDGVPYNARDLGIMRAAKNGACVILGSATPSMESFARARSGRSRLIDMPERVGPAALPEVEVVDMRNVKEPLSGTLLREMEETLGRSEQVLLFINRRGFS
ncbi:MAG TPA: primosomal protein N', partial [Deltaproteobacteria bacterium]|nr:primosomal protein N' [Deltaproteobacteria bacterium]